MVAPRQLGSIPGLSFPGFVIHRALTIMYPTQYDAVLGGQNLAFNSAAVLGGIAGVKSRLASPIVEAKIVALSEALKYGEAGKKALQDFALSGEYLAEIASVILQLPGQKLPLGISYKNPRTKTVDFRASYGWQKEVDYCQILRNFGWAEPLELPLRVTNHLNHSIPKKRLKLKILQSGEFRTKQGETLNYESLLNRLSIMQEETHYYQRGFGISLFGRGEEDFKFRLEFYKFKKLPLGEGLKYFTNYLKSGNILVV